jgi:TolB protein
MYAYLGDALEWPRWVEAVKKGQTFVTNGPLLRLEIDGRTPGDEIRLPADGGSVEVVAAVESVVPLEKMELFFSGKPVESVAISGNRGEFRRRVKVDRSGWFTLRASHSRPQHPIDDSYVVGETSPIYVYKGTQPIRSAADAKYFVQWIDDITRQAQAHGGWRSEKERAHVLGQFAEARRIMEQRVKEATE